MEGGFVPAGGQKTEVQAPLNTVCYYRVRSALEALG